MTISDMHIEVQFQVQKLGSNRVRKYQTEEIDSVLNKMQNRFIQSKLKLRPETGGFELSQIDADSIRTLIVPSYEITPYIDDNTRYKCILPHDYSYLLSDWSYTVQQCDRDANGNLVPPQTLTQSVHIKAIRQNYTEKSSAPFYETLIVNLGNRTTTVKLQDQDSDLPYGNTYTGLLRKPEVLSTLVPFIALSGGYFWEKFDNNKYPGYYIDVNINDTASPSMIIDGTSYTTDIKESVDDYQYHTGQGRYYDNRLTASNRISGLNSTIFYKSSYYSPVSELGNNILYVYRDESFTVTKVGISYIRKPLPISLPLNLSSELPEEFHQNLCDLAAEYILSTLVDEKGKAMKVDDNNRRVVL